MALRLLTQNSELREIDETVGPQHQRQAQPSRRRAPSARLFGKRGGR